MGGERVRDGRDRVGAGEESRVGGEAGEVEGRSGRSGGGREGSRGEKGSGRGEVGGRLERSRRNRRPVLSSRRLLVLVLVREAVKSPGQRSVVRCHPSPSKRLRRRRRGRIALHVAKKVVLYPRSARRRESGKAGRENVFLDDVVDDVNCSVFLDNSRREDGRHGRRRATTLSRGGADGLSSSVGEKTRGRNCRGRDGPRVRLLRRPSEDVTKTRCPCGRRRARGGGRGERGRTRGFRRGRGKVEGVREGGSAGERGVRAERTFPDVLLGGDHGGVVRTVHEDGGNGTASGRRRGRSSGRGGRGRVLGGSRL